MRREAVRRRAEELVGSLELLQCEQRVDSLEVAVAENAELGGELSRVLDGLEARLVQVLAAPSGDGVEA